MKNWAKLNNDRVVVDYITATEDDIATGKFGHPSNWVEYSTDSLFRKNQPQRDGKWKYDLFRNAFIEDKPYSSWILNEDTCKWEAPVSVPNLDRLWSWDEDNQQWY